MSKPPKETTIIALDDEPVSPATDVAVIDEDPEAAAAAVVDEDGDEDGKLPARAVRNADGSVTLPLRHPRELQIRSSGGGVRTEPYATLVFHRLTGADLRAIAAASDEARPVVMMARSTRIRQSVMNALFDRLDGVDIADAVAVVSSFFSSGRTTGR